MPRIGTVIREVYQRPGAGYRVHVELTAEELGRLEGVLWIRILWLSAWQRWLACVSAKVHQGFFPRRDYIVALAGRVRDSR